MPRDKRIKKVLLIGSGPIVIGQGAEFDYAGTQACRILQEEGVEIVLINSNPATIMSDPTMADHIYIEPLTLETIKRIILKEEVDSIVSSFGGQIGLTLCMQLAKEGFLKRCHVRLLGSTYDVIAKAEDRELFKTAMHDIKQPMIPSLTVHDVEGALAFANAKGYPLIIRPAFTLGGSGGGIAHDEEALRRIATYGLELSPIHQILVECSVAGWKEVEFEVMRDALGNAIAVCSMENLDPVGVHTGDSIVVAPALTLADREYQMLRKAALDIVCSLQVEGGCNVQFALHPTSMEYAVIEVNPRVSRSSALASKATGYPIAKVAVKIALGYTLDEIENAITKRTVAAFEPALDYVAVKFPKFPFDKFIHAQRTLGTQMKATGEVLAIADNFEDALLKAIRGAQIQQQDLQCSELQSLRDETLLERLHTPSDLRIFEVYEALRRGYSVEQLHDITMIDCWFLSKIAHMSTYTTPASYTYKMVDTCGGEFEAQTPYFYSIKGEGENEALPLIQNSQKERIIVLGSGPIRIGQGIEFDYACVHCVKTLKDMGYEVIVINNNPETVSTDFDLADRLYFEPLCMDEVMAIIDMEQPLGVMVSFGGGTAIALAQKLHARGVRILGTSADSIDICEDRERFDALLEELHIHRPKGMCAVNVEEALYAGKQLGYPVLIRPSYVLGGQNMIIAFQEEDIVEYMNIILDQHPENPVLIDKYLRGIEVEVDAICDDESILIPGIMEHIERTGIHSGDSIAVYPAMHIDEAMRGQIAACTKAICLALHVKGLLNLQYIIMDDILYVIEVNPRASRTVPYLSKVCGLSICDLATRTAMGEKLKELGYEDDFYPQSRYVSAKVPVFSFEKLAGVDTQLGPEMKSTGEVLGIGKDLKEALYKGLRAAGYPMKKDGGVFVSVRDSDKKELIPITRRFYRLGFQLHATKGTAHTLHNASIPCTIVEKIHENPNQNTMHLLESKTLSYIISTSEKGRDPAYDDVKIRRRACLLNIPTLTSLDTAQAMVECLESDHRLETTSLYDLHTLQKDEQRCMFTKMQSCGQDFIFFDAFHAPIPHPAKFAETICKRDVGVGGEGIVVMSESKQADAYVRLCYADGSEGILCGNALCCAGKFVYEHIGIKKEQLVIDTRNGLMYLDLQVKNQQVESVCVHMGHVEFYSDPLIEAKDNDQILPETIFLHNHPLSIAYVHLNVPHVVVFVEDCAKQNVQKLGEQMQHHPLFTTTIHTIFVEVLNAHAVKLRTWQRDHEPRSCGTSACAAVAAAVACGLCAKEDDIAVHMNGGTLHVLEAAKGIQLRGECKEVFNGYISIKEACK